MFMKLQRNLTFLLIFSLAVILVGNVKGDENINISALKYTSDVENGEEIILVGNGKDYGTEYFYKMYDDDDDQYRSNDDGGNNDDCDVQNCLPENWYTIDFDDSEWDTGAAPFGDEEMDGINPGTRYVCLKLIVIRNAANIPNFLDIGTSSRCVYQSAT